MSSFIIDKIVKLPCIPAYKTEDSTNYWGDLFNKKVENTTNVPQEVKDYFSVNKMKTFYFFNDKVYKHFYSTEYYQAFDTKEMDKEIEESYSNKKEHFKILENLIGKRISINDLPLGKYPVFDDELRINCSYDDIKPKIICSIGKVTGRMGDGFIVTKTTDFCEIYVSDIHNVCSKCKQVIKND